jgi:transposase-like protein
MSPRLRKAATAALARQLDAQAQRAARDAATREGAGRVRSVPLSSRAARYRCATCGATFTAWATAERHADTHGGARLDWLGI